MTELSSLGSGLAGALALTALHETARSQVPAAPRMDVLGMRALEKSMHALHVDPPSEERLHEMALAGDVIANSLYYSLVGWAPPERALACGALLGLTAGIGAVLLPGPLGLGESPSNRTRATQAMTIGWYLLGGLVAGATRQLLARRT